MVYLIVLIDRFGRMVTYLRISLTNKCNHNCIFCHREGISGSYGEELSSSDWVFVAEVGVSLGIRYYKLTGGEPLVRRDIVDIVRGISSVGGYVSMVTNGSLLDMFIDRLVDAGLKYLNISLHSLNREKFRRITGGDLDRVLKGIDKALDTGVKTRIDYVVLSWNIGEYRDIIGYAMSKGLDLNIIELIPLGLSIDEWKDLHVGLQEIRDYLEKISIGKRIRDFQSRPVYILSNGVEVTLISGLCNPEMCMKCSRLRITPEGFIKTCIYRNDQLINARKYILSRDWDNLVSIFRKAVMIREPYFKPGMKISINELYEMIAGNQKMDLVEI